MNIFAAVMTGKGTGAISTVQVFGDSAEAVIKKIFKPTGTQAAKFRPGEILLGTIQDGDEVIDQVTVGCEGPQTFAINCHGNPLIVEMIMQLLKRCGAELLTAEQLLTKILTSQKLSSTIAVEAKLAQAKAKTIEGTKIIANQINAGLSRKAQSWLDDIDKISLDKIKAEANEILHKSQIAKLIIYGCTAALIGPPNSGKSTLLNYLAGRQKSIVTDIKGTTRDWVEAKCRIGPLAVTLIDTAGLSEELSGIKETIEKAAQKKTAEIMEQADIVLLILDNNQTNNQLDEISNKKIVTILNKSDLHTKFDADRLPKILSNTTLISAKFGTGIEVLKEKFQQTSTAIDFDLSQPVCFTARQENLLQQLKKTKSIKQAASLITGLLNG